MRVRIFLRQPLFTLSGGGEHVPPSALILDGTLGEATPLGASIMVDKFLDERGRALEGKPCTLIVPGTKIDHVWVQE
ncbi:MAG: hypothetical protein Q8P18_00530 [Pseudomonadota bacterium]|nr:hypothetical protein [Pseudomonadota bacterium]